ncbi:ferric reductase like transmembrane component-domain-containing protein [Xylariaceae sp. FL1272]|nr:ferric reductase like transmembrane component-domain-containing protein [Xylariaceae sp. FL1272]
MDSAVGKNGIVGFGIELWPDLCCASCADSLSALYLSCTTFPNSTTTDSDMDDMDDMGMDDMGMDEMPETSDDCRASNTPWLQSMAYCIQQNCKTDGLSASRQAKCFKDEAAMGAETPTFEDSLPETAPTVELASDALWLNKTSLVNSELYSSTYWTYSEFKKSENMHSQYNIILIVLVLGFCLACGIVNQLTAAVPQIRKSAQSSWVYSKLQQYLLLPALVGSRHLRPMSFGYVPGRMLSIFITIYIILNVVFSSLQFSSRQPNIWFLSMGFEMCEYVGNRTGNLSLVNTAITILFAGRNNLLIGLTGWSQNTFLTLHRWSARVATVQAIVHSIIYTMAYWEPGYEGAKKYAEQVAMPFYWWGIIATIAYALAASFSVLPIRMTYYDTFLILHIGLAILALVGCWYHIVPHFGFTYGYQTWLYIAFAFWSADRLARLVRLGYYNLRGSSSAIVKAVPGCDVFEVTVFPSVSWGFGPGQHSFLYTPHIGAGKFWESHPFSIARWTRAGTPVKADARAESLSDSNEKGAAVGVTPLSSASSPSSSLQQQGRASVQFLLRGKGGMTSALRNHMSWYSYGESMAVSVLNEGPYGGHRTTLQPFQLADTVLCIIGGIGITHALGFVQEFVSAKRGIKSRTMGNVQRFILAWSAREAALIEYVKQEYLADCEGIELLFYCTGDDSESDKVEDMIAVKEGRMDIKSVMRSSLEPSHKAVVLVCGPGSMADETRQEVVHCVRDGYKVDLVQEAFAW